MTICVMGDITEPVRPKRPLQSADTGMESLKDSSIRWQYDFFFFFFAIALTNTFFYFPFRKIRTRK